MTPENVLAALRGPITHLSPRSFRPGASSPTLRATARTECCLRLVSEIPETDQWTAMPALVTCGGGPRP